MSSRIRNLGTCEQGSVGLFAASTANYNKHNWKAPCRAWAEDELIVLIFMQRPLNINRIRFNFQIEEKIYPPVDKGDSELRHGQNDEPVEDGQARDDGDNDEPEPDEDVDLLVDDVKGENAETIFLLDRT